MSTQKIRQDGIVVQKGLDTDAFDRPTVALRVESERSEPTKVRVVERIPEAIPTEAIKFHPEFDDEDWQATADRTVEFERELAPGEHVITLYTAAVTAEAAARNLLGAPEVRVGDETAAADHERGDGSETGDGATAERSEAASGTARDDGEQPPAESQRADGGETIRTGETQPRWKRQQEFGARSTDVGANPGANTAEAAVENESGPRRKPAHMVETPSGISLRLALLAGGLAGAVVFGVGYLLTYVLRAATLAAEFRDEALLYVQTAGGARGIDPVALADKGLTTPTRFEVTGWLYHDLHQVGFDGMWTTSTSDLTFDVVMRHSTDAVLYAVPPALLVVAGLVVALAAGVDRDGSVLRAAAAGASVTAGYLPLAAVSALVFVWDVSGTVGGDGGRTLTAGFGPEIVPAVGLAGLAYPLVFGAVGGLVVWAARP